MSTFRPIALFAALIAVTPFSAVANTGAPIQVIEKSLSVPAGMDAATALSAVEDLGTLFELYEPVIPWVPGVKLTLEKDLVSDAGPVVVEMPVEGAAFGRTIDERARVTATAEPMTCTEGAGARIVLEFDDSSRNIDRRIDRIEITACPRTAANGTLHIDATGSMYEGYLPRDPELNTINENIGAAALQTAFIKQVPAVFTAVETYWADRDAVAAL